MDTPRTTPLAVLLVCCLLLAFGAASALPDDSSTTPPLEQRDLLLASDGSSFDIFGSSVAIDGATAVVGAPGWHPEPVKRYQGAAYVFTRSGPGWAQSQQLLAADGASGDVFGADVALDGDTLAVAATYDDLGTHGDPGWVYDLGSVYLYTRSGTTWSLQTKLVPEEPTAESHFGSGIALQGDTLLVNSEQGVHVFTRTGASWTSQGQLPEPDEGPGGFGGDLALAGNIALVGAPGTPPYESPSDAGVVYVYKRSGNAWARVKTLTPDSPSIGDQFGCAIDFDGQTAVIAACEAYGAAQAPGWAYVFVTDGSNWTQQARLQPADGGAYFDINDVSLLDDRIALGSDDGSGPVADYAGAVYLFRREGETWTEEPPVQPADIQPNDAFPSGIALSGDELLAGASYRSVLNHSRQGAVYVFEPQLEPTAFLRLPVILAPDQNGSKGMIAYSKVGSGAKFDIFLAGQSGENKRNLTESPESEEGVRWSPDGRDLVFTRDAKLIVRNLDSGHERVITTTVYALYPSWSPDGKWIAFTGNGQGTGYDYEIFVIGVDGLGEKRLTQRVGEDSFPCWSPDGRQIVFQSYRSSRFDLAVVNADGSGLAYRTDTPEGSESAPAWSPDGSSILYSGRNGDESALFTIPAGGGVQQLVISSAEYGRWSPDGKRVVFTGGGGGIFIANADGENVKAVDLDASATLADWQPAP